MPRHVCTYLDEYICLGDGAMNKSLCCHIVLGCDGTIACVENDKNKSYSCITVVQESQNTWEYNGMINMATTTFYWKHIGMAIWEI